MEITRKQVIEELKAILEMQYWNVPLSKTALEYAISSLKTDEAYQIMYEGGEIFTKADVVAMLKEIKDEANNIRSTIWNCTSFSEGISAYNNLIQQKIDKLKEDEESG